MEAINKEKSMQVFHALQKDAVQITNGESFKEKLASGKRLRIKLGADPSRPDLHIGHAVVLRRLKWLAELGHEIIFVIGDFTAMIGDPTGRSKERVPLTMAQTRQNAATYLQQVGKILQGENIRIVFNSEWLSPLQLADVLSIAGNITLARLLERDDFETRYKACAPIGLHELFYPLLQAYDSVFLKADVEVGGTDQTYNLLAGRELQKKYGQSAQDVLTFPLLPGLCGKAKMSKSLDNYIGISEPAEIMYEKCMRVPDSVLPDYFRLTTGLGEADYLPCLQADIIEAHHLFARETVACYHSAEAVEKAGQAYLQKAAGAPESMPEFTSPESVLPAAKLVFLAGLSASLSEARRLIAGGGIAVNGVRVESDKQEISLAGGVVVCRGKKRYAKIISE